MLHAEDTALRTGAKDKQGGVKMITGGRGGRRGDGSGARRSEDEPCEEADS